MKKIKRLLVVAAMALALGAASKAQSQAAVTGVKQVDDSTSSVTVKCDAVLQANYYYLEMSTDKVNWVYMDVTSNPNSLYASGLTAGRTYYARVGICDDYEYVNSVQIPTNPREVSAVTDIVTAPSGYPKVTQTKAATKSFSVVINGMAGANYYCVNYNNLTLAQGASNKLTTANTLLPGTGYWIRAYAGRRSSSGYIAYGSYDYEKMQTLANAIPKGSFGITNAYMYIDSYTFSVAAGNLDVDGWQWQLTNAKGNKVLKSGQGSSFSTSLKGTFYKYRVRSYVECGTGKSYSAWSTFKTVAIPNSVSGRRVGKKALRVSIGKVSGATKLAVYISTSEKSGFKKVKTVSAKKRTLTIKKIGKKKLKTGKTYYVKIIPMAKVGKKTIKAQTYAVYNFKLYK